MSLGRPFARLMAMDDAAWARHANPWSGWSRLATTPVLFLALWSHVRLGWWALLPIGLVGVWLWANPRVFPPPASRTAWMTRGVLGERLWVEGRADAGPEVRWILALQAWLTLTGVVGIALQAFWVGLVGLHAGAATKLWFLDRMVRVYDAARAGEAGIPDE
jgi:hypothetical protein